MAVDELSQEFLRVLLENDGESTTTTIRNDTGMTRGQVTHRFNKLDDLGWIDITRADQGKGEREPPKVAVLTDEGDQAIRSGDAGKKVLEKDSNKDESIELSKEQVEKFHKEVDSVKSRLNVVVDKIENTDGEVESGSSQKQKLVQSEKSEPEVETERVEKLEREVARLRETVELLNEAVSEQSKSQSESKSEDKSKSDINEEVINELKDEQEYLREWMDVAEKHMVAMRLFMEDNDKDFERYLKSAEDRK